MSSKQILTAGLLSLVAVGAQAADVKDISKSSAEGPQVSEYVVGQYVVKCVGAAKGGENDCGTILRDKPSTPWFELIADDLLLSSGRQRVIEKVREHYPIALHAVGLNIAGPDPLDTDYLDALASVYQHTEAAWLSDHLCWSAANKRQHFDLLPFAFTKNMLDYLCPRIDQVQQRLKRPLVLENISYYQRFQQDEMGEWDFTAELMKRTGCQMLLDLNNLWTNATNFDLDPHAELSTLTTAIDAKDIVQIHVAGSKFHPSADEVVKRNLRSLW